LQAFLNPQVKHILLLALPNTIAQKTVVVLPLLC